MVGSPRGYGGIINNPFFWLWMFDRPWVFGHPRPPVVTTRPAGGPVTIDPNQAQAPARAGRSYTTYAPDGRPGTKPPPAKRGSRGPGAAATGGTTRASVGGFGGASTAGSSAVSRGQTRPGQGAATAHQPGTAPPRVSSPRTAQPPRVQAPRRVSVPRIRVPTRGLWRLPPVLYSGVLRRRVHSHSAAGDAKHRCTRALTRRNGR